VTILNPCPKPGKKKLSRADKMKRDSRHCPERLAYLHGKPCVIDDCRKPGVVHHIKTGRGLKDDFATIPLCHHHHQGNSGIHTYGRGLWTAWYGSPEKHLADTDAVLKKLGLNRLLKP
jgi:hypothetical protein